MFNQRIIPEDLGPLTHHVYRSYSALNIGSLNPTGLLYLSIYSTASVLVLALMG